MTVSTCNIWPLQYLDVLPQSGVTKQCSYLFSLPDSKIFPDVLKWEFRDVLRLPRAKQDVCLR